MTKAWSRAKCLCAVMPLLLVGCVKIDVAEPVEGQEYTGQPGQVLDITFRAKITNNSTSATTINFSLDGQDYWDNVFHTESCPPGVTWVEANHDVEVTGEAETHNFDVWCGSTTCLESVLFEVVPE